jgi:hypothetical protein
MSRPYVIRVAETVRRHVVVEDGVEARLDVLPVLAADETSALLAEELERRGFTIANGTATRVESDGVELRVDIAARKVHVGKREARDVEVTLERDVRSETKISEAQAKKVVASEADHQIERAREEQRRQMTQAIEKRLGDVRAELDEVVVKVTQSALRKRASQIGEIQSIEEDESGSMTIRVRV